jgi:hypothetical protein
MLTSKDHCLVLGDWSGHSLKRVFRHLSMKKTWWPLLPKFYWGRTHICVGRGLDLAPLQSFVSVRRRVTSSDMQLKIWQNLCNGCSLFRPVQFIFHVVGTCIDLLWFSLPGSLTPRKPMHPASRPAATHLRLRIPLTRQRKPATFWKIIVNLRVLFN